MTVAQFLEELRKEGIQFYRTKEFHIREVGTNLCPICALVEKKKLANLGPNPSVPNDMVHSIGSMYLNLTRVACDIIVDAADNPEYRLIDYTKVREMRSKLLELV